MTISPSMRAAGGANHEIRCFTFLDVQLKQRLTIEKLTKRLLRPGNKAPEIPGLDFMLGDPIPLLIRIWFPYFNLGTLVDFFIVHELDSHPPSAECSDHPNKLRHGEVPLVD